MGNVRQGQHISYTLQENGHSWLFFSIRDLGARLGRDALTHQWPWILLYAFLSVDLIQHTRDRVCLEVLSLILVLIPIGPNYMVCGLASPLGLCRGGDLCGPYSVLSQDGKLVVEDIPLVVWGLSFLFGPVRGYHRMGPQCLVTPPVSASSIYAAVVYVSGG